MSTQMQNAPTEGRSACEWNLGGSTRKRIAASYRMEPLTCGCRDPWLCRCHRSDYMRPEAVYAAHRHLAAAGLAPRRTA